MSRPDWRENVTYEFSDTFLTNTPIGEPHRKGEPWIYYLLGESITKDRHHKRIVRTIRGRTKREADAELRRLFRKPNVKLRKP